MTTTPNSATVGDAPPPDPEGKAADLLDQDAPRGRDRKRKRRGTGRPPGRPRKTPAADPAGEPAAPVVTAEHVQAMTIMMGTLWDLIGTRVAKLEPLNDEESYRLGAATAPVFVKYAGLLGDWSAEFTLLVVLGGLITAKLPKRDAAPGVFERLDQETDALRRTTRDGLS